MKHLLVIACLAVPSVAAAEKPAEKENLEEKTNFENLTKEVQQYADLANKACASTITFDFDKASFKDVWNSKGKTGLDVFRLDAITEPFRQIRFICLDGKTSADAVRKGIKTVRLGFATPPKHGLAKGTFTAHVLTDGNKRAWADEMKAYLKKTL